MTAQQQQRIERLEQALERSHRLLNILVMDAFIYGEKYAECHFCGSDEPDQHMENCIVLEAIECRHAIEHMLHIHALRQGG